MKKEWRIALLSFMLPIFTLLLTYVFNDVYPFGSKSLLINDLNVQHMEFLQYFRRIFYEGKSIFYSFDIGMGKGIFGVLAYYIISPVNFILIIFPNVDIEIMIFFIVLVKIGLAGFGSCFYLNKKFKTNDYSVLFFSLCYSLMTYNVVSYIQIIWLDAVAIFPVVIYFTEKFIENNKKKGLITTISLLVLNNFYMAYMILFFVVIYFWYVEFIKNEIFNIRKSLKKFFRFLSIIILCTMITAFLTVPTYLSLVKENSIKNFSIFNINYKFGDIFSKIFIDTFHTTKTFGTPNLYCGIFIAILTIGYFFDRKISVRTKVSTALIFIIMYLFLKLELLYIIWHALDKPNGFPARFSFIVSFFMILCAYKVYLNLNKKLSKKLLYITFFLFIGIIFVKKEYISTISIVINSIVLIIYAILLFYSEYTLKKRYLFYILITSEICINSILVYNNLQIKEVLVLYNNHIIEKNTINKALEFIRKNDSGIYRIEQDISQGYNKGFGNGYMTMDIYSSTYNPELHEFLRAAGLPFIPKLGIYNSTTQITDSILGTKYILSDNPNYPYIKLKKIDKCYIYINENAFPMAVAINKDILEINSYKNYRNPFEYQNEIMKKLFAENKEFFIKSKVDQAELINVKIVENKDDKITYEKIDKSKKAYLKYNIESKNKEKTTYLYVKNRKMALSEIYIEIDKNNMDKDIFDGAKILKLGEKSEVIIEIVKDTITLHKDVFYELDRKKFESIVKNVKNQNNIEKITDGYVKINISNTAKDKILMTSIPYEKGWELKINGKKTKIEKIMGVFIGVKLNSGNNTVELKYSTPGLDFGIFISIVGIIILIIVNSKKNLKICNKQKYNNLKNK